MTTASQASSRHAEGRLRPPRGTAQPALGDRRPAAPRLATATRRELLAAKQKPYGVVLACIDSRVRPSWSSTPGWATCS